MHFKPQKKCQRFQKNQIGMSLIVVMIMLVIIGLVSAAAMRSATSGEKLANNIRVQNLAQQYAEAALRYCEAELRKADASRVSTLAESNIITVAVGGSTGWEQTASWLQSTGGAAASRTTLPLSSIKSSDSSFSPTTLPQCIVEKQTMADANVAYVVTARGFSPDYSADSTTGKTLSGSVVWLQSISFFE